MKKITEEIFMKKIIALLMAGLMTATAFAGCGAKKDESGSNAASKTSGSTADSSSDSTSDSAVTVADWDTIKSKGEMTIGITYLEPLNYKDKETGELLGFETEFAQAVCDELGVKANFQEINWDSKEVELSSKTIDCIWNGLTISDERKATMSISIPYMNNNQVMVVKKDKADKFSTADGIKGAMLIAEKGSAGEEVAQSDEYFKETQYIGADTQSKALMEVKAGTSDIAVIDYVMAKGSLREGSDYSDLTILESKNFEPEEYGVAFRKGSDMTQKVNEAMQKVADNGKLKEIADKYNLTDLLKLQVK